MRRVLCASQLFRRQFPACKSCRDAASLASMLEVSKLPQKKLDSVVFPVKNLEKVLSPDIDKTNFRLFDPTIEEITAAERLFRPSGKHMIDYITSAIRMDHAPDLQQPEGHTRKMNFFKVGKAFTLVDMPGYGYRAPEDFAEMVEGYIQERRNLKRTFLLVDGSAGIQEADLIAVEMCEEFGIPYVLVVTKIDRSRPAALVLQYLKIEEFIKTQTQGCFPQPFLVSSLHFSGVHLLRCFIAHITGNLPKTK
ncbi:GTP-binding protein 8 isoform X2 [Mixophyes fleayi]|uniref:GTP-binding protein 8 isoform X2 n=1 Tax=Mixophyes fleayi TaxID=3061075 RepID=UPI003F4DA544